MPTTAPIALIGTAGSSAWNRENTGRFGSAWATKTTGAAVRGGVIYGGGDPLKVVSAGGRNLTINPGVAEIATPTSQGSLKVFQPTPVSLTAETADGTNPRWDLVIAEIDDLGTASSFGNFRIVEGIPASSPQVPSTNWLDPSDPVSRPLHNGGWIPLAACLVPASGSGGSVTTITDKRVLTVAAGGVVPVENLAATSSLARGTAFFTLDAERFGVKTTSGYQLFRPNTAGTGVLAGTIPSSALPYSYQDARTISANGTGKTAITWPAFNAVQSVQVAPSYGGAIGANPVVILYSEVTTSGCNLEFVDKDGGIVTSGSYVVSLLVSGV